MEIRKARINESNKIIEVANKVFGIDFRKFMPKVYTKDDFYKYHFVSLINDEIVGLSGNLINKIKVNNKEYKYSFIGTVSTLEDYRYKGVMKNIMQEIDKENIENDIVFSMLTGLRKRYSYYGYEKATQRFNYEISEYEIHLLNIKEGVTIKEYDESLLDEYYKIYLDNQILNLRSKEDFFLSILKEGVSLFSIYYKDELKGYFAYSISENNIIEIYSYDVSLYESVIKLLIDKFNLKGLSISINPLDKENILELDKISEERIITDYTHIKIYKTLEFIELLVNINLKIRKINDLNEIYKIDDEIIEINIKDNFVEVKRVNKEYKREFTKQEFIRFALGFNNLYFNESNLFPLLFDINEADLF